MWSRSILQTWRTSHRQIQCIKRRSYAQINGTPEIYDVVCVGGGPAGLSLLAALSKYEAKSNQKHVLTISGSSPATSGLKVALVEGQDLRKAKLQNPTTGVFSNRCSSLTPASVGFLKSKVQSNTDDGNR